MNREYQSVLITVFLYRCLFLFAVLSIGTVINLSYLIRLKKRFQKLKSGRKSRRIRDYETSRKNCIGEAALGLIGIVVAFFVWALPPYIDLRSGEVIQSEATYIRESLDTQTGVPNIGGNVCVIINGEALSVELYPGYSEAEYPVGTYNAVIWYSGRSKILLDIELQEDIDDVLTANSE